MSDTAAQKATARKVAYRIRKVAHAAYNGATATENLLEFLAPHLGKQISAYMPIRTEIDSLPAMTRLVTSSPVAVPVVVGQGQPLEFHRWHPKAEMKDGAFGAKIPTTAEPAIPAVIILPLLAFDNQGFRLGYGGGYYDRTLELLRANGSVLAVGFAYSAQQVSAVPRDTTDQPLDALVTEKQTFQFPSLFP